MVASPTCNLRLEFGEPEHALEDLVGLETRHTITDPRVLGAIEGVRAECTLALGTFDQALIHARSAERLLRCNRPLHAYGLAVLARAELMSGDLKRALEVAEVGIQLYEQLGTLGEEETNLHAAIIQILTAANLDDRAQALSQKYVERLTARAAEIADPGVARSFLQRVPASRRLLALAEVLR